MAPQIKLYLNPPKNNQFYSNYDHISGSVSLDIGKPVSIKQINVRFKGFIETVTKLDPIVMRNQAALMTPVQDNKTIHTLVNMSQKVFPPENVLSAIEGDLKPFQLKEGVHEYEFQLPKLPKKPKCLPNHTKGLMTYLDKDHIRLPPSFNNEWKEMLRFDNLDLFFYSFGKILYMVEVQIELGKPKSWYRPFEKILTEIQVVEFIPQSKDLTFKLDDKPSKEILESLKNSNNEQVEKPSGKLKTEKATVPTNAPLVDVMTQTPDVRVYRSTYRIGLPDDDSVMWLEARSSNLRRTFRGDPLFAGGSGKFDSIFIVMMGDSQLIDRLRVVPTRVQLNLLETVTYLSQGIANQNVSSLKLAEDKIPLEQRGTVLKNSWGRYVQFSAVNPNQSRWECELRLKNHPHLKKLKFNEEDYRHRGNRLYSFKSCSIKRIFSFQLLVDWDIVGFKRQSEIIVDPMQIFADRNRRAQEEALPLYVPPPSYTESTQQ